MATSQAQSPAPAGGSKVKLINATIALLASKGYESTGISEILEMASVSKSNFYYHFKSKEELCLAALDKLSHIFFTTVINQTVGNKRLSPRQRFVRHFDYFLEVMATQSCDGGCVFTNLEAETSDFHPAFREKLDQVDTETARTIEESYRDGIAAGEFRGDVSPAEMAQYILSLFKGTMILAKAKKDPEIIRRNKNLLFALVAPPA